MIYADSRAKQSQEMKMTDRYSNRNRQVMTDNYLRYSEQFYNTVLTKILLLYLNDYNTNINGMNN